MNPVDSKLKSRFVKLQVGSIIYISYYRIISWEQRKLGDCVTFLDTMRKPLKESEREKGIYPYYGASGIVDYVSDYIFDEELVLLSEDGANITDRNYPVCFLASGKYWVNNHAHVLKVNAENENNFICNSLERMDFTQYNSGMAMPKLNKDVCYNITLFCPVYEEQKQIGDFFRHLDTLITLHQREYFPFLFGSDSAKIVQKTISWEQRKLGDICPTFLDGDWIESKDQSDSGVRLIQTGNIGVGTYIEKEDRAKWVSEDTFNRLHCEEVFAGDILISRLPEPAGRACIVPETGLKMITAVDVTIARTSDEYDSNFILQFLCSDNYFKAVGNTL